MNSVAEEMKYNSTTHITTSEAPRQSRRMRRSQAFAPKYKKGWFGFWFWMTAMGATIGLALLITNIGS